jgi:redox-sensitive bicupin YhaK (pirin superfamily)
MSTAGERHARTIEGIYPGPGFHWVGDGFRVRGYFSVRRDLDQRLSPFLLLDYHPPYDYPATSNSRRGVGPHPHRGFETVTLAFQGSVAHHDSAGNGGVIGPGDVQWMTAASGVMHREYHEESYARRGGPFHMMQVWVNLPRAHKMDPPGYQAIVDEQIGRVSLPGGAGTVRVIAGEYQGVKGPAKTFTPINLFDVELAPRGTVSFAFPARENAALLVMSGALEVNGRAAAEGSLVLLANDGERVEVEAETGARFVVLEGEPIDEPIARYGPFVMNTERELEQAFADFNRGKFGQLDD